MIEKEIFLTYHIIMLAEYQKEIKSLYFCLQFK